MMKTKKVIAIFIAAVIFTFLGLYVYFSYDYAYTLSEKPLPEVGRIYPFNVHGTIVYLTRQEDLWMRWLFWCMMAFVIIAFLFTYYCKPFKREN